MNQNFIPTSILYIYEGHYPNIQIVLKHNKEFFYRPRMQKQLMVTLSPTQPLTIHDALPTPQRAQM